MLKRENRRKTGNHIVLKKIIKKALDISVSNALVANVISGLIIEVILWIIHLIGVALHQL